MIDYAPAVALTELEGQVISIRRGYERCFDELKRREKETVGDLKKRVERLEKRLGEVDQALKNQAKRSTQRADSLESITGKRHALTMKSLDNLQEASKRPFATKRMLTNLQEKMDGWRKGLWESVKELDGRLVTEGGDITTISENLEVAKEMLAASVESLDEVRTYLQI